MDKRAEMMTMRDQRLHVAISTMNNKVYTLTHGVVRAARKVQLDLISRVLPSVLCSLPVDFRCDSCVMKDDQHPSNLVTLLSAEQNGYHSFPLLRLQPNSQYYSANGSPLSCSALTPARIPSSHSSTKSHKMRTKATAHVNVTVRVIPSTGLSI